jgi:hypothetical protein
MATKPIDGLGARSYLPKVYSVWKSRSDSCERVSTETGSWNTQGPVADVKFQLLKVGIWCFKQAQKCDPNEWQFAFMIGKMLAKCKGAPNVSFNVYLIRLHSGAL